MPWTICIPSGTVGQSKYDQDGCHVFPSCFVLLSIFLLLLLLFLLLRQTDKRENKNDVIWNVRGKILMNHRWIAVR